MSIFVFFEILSVVSGHTESRRVDRERWTVGSAEWRRDRVKRRKGSWSEEWGTVIRWVSCVWRECSGTKVELAISLLFWKGQREQLLKTWRTCRGFGRNQKQMRKRDGRRYCGFGLGWKGGICRCCGAFDPGRSPAIIGPGFVRCSWPAHDTLRSMIIRTVNMYPLFHRRTME